MCCRPYIPARQRARVRRRAEAQERLRYAAACEGMGAWNNCIRIASETLPGADRTVTPRSALLIRFCLEGACARCAPNLTEKQTDSIVLSRKRCQATGVTKHRNGFCGTRVRWMNNFDEFSSARFGEYLLGQSQQLAIVKITEVVRHL